MADFSLPFQLVILYGRESASRILLYPVWMHAGDRLPTFWWPIFERGILAFQDLECVDLLE